MGDAPLTPPSFSGNIETMVLLWLHVRGGGGGGKERVGQAKETKLGIIWYFGVQLGMHLKNRHTAFPCSDDVFSLLIPEVFHLLSLFQDITEFIKTTNVAIPQHICKQVHRPSLPTQDQNRAMVIRRHENNKTQVLFSMIIYSYATDKVRRRFLLCCTSPLPTNEIQTLTEFT